MGGNGVDRRLPQAEIAERVRGDGAMTGHVSLSLFGIQIVPQAGETPDLRVLAETHRQATHDGLGGQHVTAQMLAGHARLHDRDDLFAGRAAHGR